MRGSAFPFFMFFLSAFFVMLGVRDDYTVSIILNSFLAGVWLCIFFARIGE